VASNCYRSGTVDSDTITRRYPTCGWRPTFTNEADLLTLPSPSRQQPREAQRNQNNKGRVNQRNMGDKIDLLRSDESLTRLAQMRLRQEPCIQGRISKIGTMRSKRNAPCTQTFPIVGKSFLTARARHRSGIAELLVDRGPMWGTSRQPGAHRKCLVLRCASPRRSRSVEEHQRRLRGGCHFDV